MWLCAAATLVQAGGQSPGGDFTLNSALGPMSLGDLKGKVVLLFFGYTSCPDVCPMSLARISACLQGMEPHEAEEVRGLFVTLDPARDTVDRVSEYAKFFHRNIVGLTGSVSEIDAVTSRYGVEYERLPAPDSPLGYTISHPTSIYLIDKEGTLVGRVADAAGVEALRTEVLKLLEDPS